MRWQRLGVALTFVIAWAMNPALLTGCARLGLTYDFGEPEMVALVSSASNAGPYRVHRAAGDVDVSFTLTQVEGEDRGSMRAPSLMRAAHACGSRTFLRSAGACLDTTNLPVEGTWTVTTADGAEIRARARVTGSLLAMGTRLQRAQLELHAGGDFLELTSTDGKSFEARVLTLNDGRSAP